MEAPEVKVAAELEGPAAIEDSRRSAADGRKSDISLLFRDTTPQGGCKAFAEAKKRQLGSDSGNPCVTPTRSASEVELLTSLALRVGVEAQGGAKSVT